MEPCAPVIVIKLSNKKRMSATHTAFINIPNIPLEACKYHIFPDMDSKVLLPIVMFCNNGHHPIFTPMQLILEHQMDP